MANENDTPSGSPKPASPAKSFIQDLFSTVGTSLLRLAASLLLAFVIGTGAAAIACLYYGVPLIFSLIGGFIVLGFAVALIAYS